MNVEQPELSPIANIYLYFFFFLILKNFEIEEYAMRLNGDFKG